MFRNLLKAAHPLIVCQIWNLIFFPPRSFCSYHCFTWGILRIKSQSQWDLVKVWKMWIRLKIDSPRGTESEKQQSPKAARSSPRSIFLSCWVEYRDILPKLYYSQRIWARRAESGPGIIRFTWYAGHEFCQNSACGLTFREFAQKISLYTTYRLCIQAWPWMLNEY